MAINTRAKRSSVQSYATGFTQPPPDGTIAEGDRAHVSWLYSGMDYDNPVPPAEGTPMSGVRGWFGRFMRRAF